uniref:Uncharacterized protein n=1 Tax=Arundo donax TaxID=35708 RepID=A0A0A9BKK8_ARUDO
MSQRLTLRESQESLIHHCFSMKRRSWTRGGWKSTCCRYSSRIAMHGGITESKDAHQRCHQRAFCCEGCL